ncbi:MAG: ATP phosphoribosyltransferase [Candidatus Abyssobacteria bacterium SURF_17]|uniref:ATP phosphoribosyltransferase n=1 Tax=Candidatus Abyssobacteria bacterium SURF_17 TaxID=2093361 RepID=A0A419EUX7_9BACT|nr:MAG: ATP phosphoribosyltransferase [Candidatus Abyssubacteria bacterium SURF_17]
MKLRIGLPKGSLQEATRELFRRAGYSIVFTDRSYYPAIDDPELELLLIRAQEIPRYVNHGILDVGIAGTDMIEEDGAQVVTIAKLLYSKQGPSTVRWVLAVPEESPFKAAEDLEGKTVATELVNTTKKYLKRKGVRATVEFSWGATEVKPPDLADAIVELTETGSSLRANKLRIIDVITESQTCFFANKESWEDPWKRQKAENLAVLLQGALNAAGMVGLKMNVNRAEISKVLSELPALKTPTISNLSDPSWVAVEVILEEKVVREIIPKLKAAGAQGIIEYPLTKVIY